MLFRWQNDRNEPLVLPDQRLTIDCSVMEPQKLGPYELQNRLGRGGMGAVYEARHEQTGETVAVKLLAAHLTDDPGLRQRFEAEIETLKPLRSSGIVHLLAFGEQDGQPYFAMELVRGKSLSDRLKSVGPLPWRQAATLASDIVRALKVAHDHGIIHRDLKPANLLLVDDPQAAGTSIKLADFGIARLFGSAGHTAHGSIVGTAEFMAPEQAAGKPLDARADLYALGLVMFTMLTGKPPFRGAQLTKIITQQLHEKPPSISQICPDVPAELGSLIEQLLEKNPADRPASALAVGRRLTAILSAEDAGNQATPAPLRAGSPTSQQDGPVVIRPQVPPSTPTAISRRSEQTHQPIGCGIDLDAATRDATRAGGIQATDETIDLAPQDLTPQDPAQTTDLPAGLPADAGEAAATTDFSRPDKPPDNRGGIQHRSTEEATGRRPAGSVVTGPSQASADTVVDQFRGSRFVTMAEIERANEEVATRQRFRQRQLHFVVTILTAGMAGMIAYLLLKPPTADQLYERIATVAGAPDGDLRDVARDIDNFLASFPDDPRASEIAKFDLRRKVDLLEKRSRRRILGDRAVPAIERDYRAALSHADTSPTAAVTALEAIETLHRNPEPNLSQEDHAVWMALVQRQIATLEERARGEQQADRERADEILAEAATLVARANNAPAEEAASLLTTRQSLLLSLIQTYADRPHMAKAVATARSQLAAQATTENSEP